MSFYWVAVNQLFTYRVAMRQGILSVPGISGYKWVTARIGHFYKDNFFS